MFLTTPGRYTQARSFVQGLRHQEFVTGDVVIVVVVDS